MQLFMQLFAATTRGYQSEASIHSTPQLIGFRQQLHEKFHSILYSVIIKECHYYNQQYKLFWSIKIWNSGILNTPQAGHLYKYYPFYCGANGSWLNRLNYIIKISTIVCGKKMSSLTDDQSRFIVLKFGELKSPSEIRRAFRQKYFPSNSRQVPHIREFHRLFKILENHGTVQHLPITGKRPATVDDVERVKQFFENSPKASIRSAINELQISYGRIWKIRVTILME